MSDATAPLVTPEWLAERLASPGLVVVDGSWHLPATGRDPHAEHAAGRIPGAVFFDIEAISDRTGIPTPTSHILLTAKPPHPGGGVSPGILTTVPARRSGWAWTNRSSSATRSA